MKLKAELNKVFAFFLEKQGIKPSFKKTNYGYRTYDNKWKLFEGSLSIIRSVPAKIYNGYDYDIGTEETKYQIVQKPDMISMMLVYKKLI